MIPEVRQELGCYHWIYIYPHFIKKNGVYKRGDWVGVEPDPNQEDTEDVVLDDNRERHWRMVFEDNNGGVRGTKALIHAKKWDVYNSEKQVLVKGGYLVEVFDKDRNTVIWEVVDEHVVEEGVEHEEVGLQGFDFNLFDEERGVCVGENVNDLPYF